VEDLHPLSRNDFQGTISSPTSSTSGHIRSRLAGYLKFPLKINITRCKIEQGGIKDYPNLISVPVGKESEPVKMNILAFIFYCSLIFIGSGIGIYCELFTINPRSLFIIFFMLFIFIDYFIKNSHFIKHSRIKDYYIRLSKLNYFYLSFILFIFFTIIFFALSWVATPFPSAHKAQSAVEAAAIPLTFWFGDISFNIESITSYMTESGSNNSNGNVSTPNVGGVINSTGGPCPLNLSPNLNNSLNNSAVNLNSVNNPNLTINSPNLSVSIPTGALNNIAASLSATGGAVAAVKLALKIPGHPAARSITGAGVFLGVQSTTHAMSHLLNSNNNSNDSNNYIGSGLSTLFEKEKVLEQYSEYPLNLLPDINTFINVEILCIILLLYFYIFKLVIDYLNKKSFNFTNKRIEKIVLFIQNRYTTLWSKAQKIYNIILLVLLIHCIIMSKICMYYILNP
jgi:hypothetical protein